MKIGLNNTYENVRNFHAAFGHPAPTKPTIIDMHTAIKRFDWMKEEIEEFLAAAEVEDMVEMADAMIDTIYFAIGTLVEMGIEPQGLFEIVQNANMSKLWEDGKPHYNNEGKVIKPPTWQDPHEKLKEEINRQLKSNT